MSIVIPLFTPNCSLYKEVTFAFSMKTWKCESASIYIHFLVLLWSHDGPSLGDFSEPCGSKVTEMNIEPVLHVRGQADHGCLSDLLLRTFDRER